MQFASRITCSPSGRWEVAVGAYSDEVREVVRGLAEKESKRGLDLAWHLGEIEEKQLYLQWHTADGHPISSFNSYWNSDLRGHVARSHAYALKDVGQVWRTRRSTIERVVGEGRTGIAELIDVTVAVKNGLDYDKALRYLEFGEPYLDSIEGQHATGGVRGKVQVELWVDADKYEDFRRGLTLNAVRCQLPSQESALIELAIQESMDPLLPKRFEKYRDLIFAGEFQCKLCGIIPEHPTDHHIFPVSLCQGWGPQVLLCEAPCHPQVQKRWLEYAIMWYGKKWVEEQRRAMERDLGMTIRWNEAA